MNQAQADQLFRAITGAIERAIKEALEPIEKQLAEIRAEVAAKKYCGTFQRAQEYKRHNTVTHSGSLWIALTDDPGVPGESPHWQLAVKAGRNGRDAR